MSTVLAVQRKEIQVNPYKLVYEDITGDFSLTNLTGYLTTVTVVADIATRNGLSPSNGDVVEVTDASGDVASYGTKRYYYDGEGWVLIDNVKRTEIAIIPQLVIHKTTGDVTVAESTTADPETATEWTFDYTEDGWYELTLKGIRYKSTLSTDNTLSDIWPDGVANDLTWDAGSNVLQYITEAIVETPPTISYSYQTISNDQAFNSSYVAQYTTVLEDFPYEYACDCLRTAFDQYMDEKESNGESEDALFYWDRYQGILREKKALEFAVSKNLYSEFQKIVERLQLDCACITC